MPIHARYVHTNLIARDWASLSRFYCEVMGCQVVPPERDYQGPEIERGTKVRGAALRGVHLALPGYEKGGPTLEVYSYSTMEGGEQPSANRLGFGHLAFSVDDVPAAREAVVAGGGAVVGEVVTLQLATGAKVTWCYVRDPEGNLLELQSWG